MKGKNMFSKNDLVQFVRNGVTYTGMFYSYIPQEELDEDLQDGLIIVKVNKQFFDVLPSEVI